VFWPDSSVEIAVSAEMNPGFDLVIGDPSSSVKFLTRIRYWYETSTQGFLTKTVVGWAEHPKNDGSRRV
jgi:hypothetical protein